jgi:hypothetical protein
VAMSTAPMEMVMTTTGSSGTYTQSISTKL